MSHTYALKEVKVEGRGLKATSKPCHNNNPRAVSISQRSTKGTAFTRVVHSDSIVAWGVTRASLIPVGNLRVRHA